MEAQPFPHSICHACRHVRITGNARGSRFLQCGASALHAGWPKYPPQPVRACPHFADAPGEPAAVLFDLGGVLYQIDVARSMAAFQRLGARGSQVSPDHPIFHQFETGALSPAQWRDAMRREWQLSCSDEEMDAAWNELLLGPDPRAMPVLETLSHLPLVLLSNTNEIHFNCLEPQCRELFARFSSLHFSFRLGLRKPDPAIFERVLAAAGLDPARTWFIDDNLQNVQAARSAGLMASHFTSWERLSWAADDNVFG